jgi:hypothetical protein
MTFRAVLVFIVLGFVGLLVAMGLRSFVAWLKQAYPRRYRVILGGLALIVTAAIVWMAFELVERPAFRSNDLITLHEPVVATTVTVDRDSRTMACIIDSSEHLAVITVDGGTLTARVDSNNGSAPVYCAIGSDVRIELAWLHRHSLTHR